VYTQCADVIIMPKVDGYHLLWRRFKKTRIAEEGIIWFPGEDPEERGVRETGNWLYINSKDWQPLEPEMGGQVVKRGVFSLMRVYLDDLFLCPKCGRFRGLGKYFDEPLPFKEGKIDIEALPALIESRRIVPEWIVRKCDRKSASECKARSGNR